MRMLAMTAALAGTFVSACVTSKAVTEVKTSAGRPSLVVEGAGPTDVLRVDGVSHGPAASYAAKAESGALFLEKGAHKVEILSSAGEVRYTEEIFLGDDTVKTVNAGGAVKQ